MVDARLRAGLAASEATAGVALVAVGGYGAARLCPRSDVDLLLLHDGRVAGGLDAVVRSVCYPLWDAGMAVGHAVRTVREAARAGDDTVETATALLTRRLVAGDRGLLDRLDARLARAPSRQGRQLVQALGRDAPDRAALPVGRLEPDLKCDPGGLRDLDRLEWAAAGLLGRPSLEALVETGTLGAPDHSALRMARAVLLAARTALHLTDARSGDRLRLDLHDDVAARLGGEADGLLRAVGLAMRAVAHVAARAWPRLLADAQGGRSRPSPAPRPVDDGVAVVDGLVTLAAERDLHADPTLAWRAVAAAAREGAHLDRRTAERVRTTFASARPWWDDAARDALLTTLRQGEAGVRALRDADHLGLLVAYLPGWERVRGLPQRNPFHRFDLDTHLLHTVAWLVAIGEGALEPDHARRWAALEDPDALLLAAWLHDVGKAWPGDHSLVGAELVAEWLADAGFGSARAMRVAKLVRLHLLLPDVATRRDLDDPEEIAGVAEAVGDAETLDGLLLLALADARATGPSVWSAWKDGLLATLHARVRAALRDDAAVPGAPEDTAAAARRVAAAAGASQAAVDRLLADVPRRYVVAASAEQIAAHLALLAERAPDRPAAAWRAGSVPGTAVLSVVAPDRVGLLAACAGIISSHDLRLLDARAVTSGQGTALDWFTVAVDGEPPAALAEEVVAAIEGEVDVAARIAARERRRDARLPAEAALAKTSVTVDASGDLVRLEVRAPSTPGLVYRLTRAVADTGISVAGLKAEVLGAQARVALFFPELAAVLRETLVAALTTAAAPPDHLRRGQGARPSRADAPGSADGAS